MGADLNMDSKNFAISAKAAPAKLPAVVKPAKALLNSVDKAVRKVILKTSAGIRDVSGCISSTRLLIDEAKDRAAKKWFQRLPED